MQRLGWATCQGFSVSQRPQGRKVSNLPKTTGTGQASARQSVAQQEGQGPEGTARQGSHHRRQRAGSAGRGAPITGQPPFR